MTSTAQYVQNGLAQSGETYSAMFELVHDILESCGLGVCIGQTEPSGSFYKIWNQVRDLAQSEAQVLVPDAGTIPDEVRGWAVRMLETCEAKTDDPRYNAILVVACVRIQSWIDDLKERYETSEGPEPSSLEEQQAAILAKLREAENLDEPPSTSGRLKRLKGGG